MSGCGRQAACMEPPVEYPALMLSFPRGSTRHDLYVKVAGRYSTASEMSESQTSSVADCGLACVRQPMVRCDPSGEERGEWHG
eukprot:3838632-Rhodomonas_salina.4